MSLPTQRDSGGPNSGEVPLSALYRLEAKLDVALAQHGAKLESQGADINDHEARLRVVEAKPTVSPKTLWTAITGAAGLLALLAPFLERLYALHP